MLFFLLAVLLIVGSGLSYYHWIVRSPVSHAQAASAIKSGSNDPMQIYVSATSGAPDYDTSMRQNDPSWGWWEGSLTQDRNGNCAFIGGGAFYASMQNSGISPCLEQGFEVNDFAYQVQMTISTGDEGGLIFRSDDVDQSTYTLSNYYFFSISQDGHYSLYYYQNDKSQTRLAAGSSSSINKVLNQVNLLTVIAHGSDIYLLELAIKHDAFLLWRDIPIFFYNVAKRFYLSMVGKSLCHIVIIYPGRIITCPRINICPRLVCFPIPWLSRPMARLNWPVML